MKTNYAARILLKIVIYHYYAIFELLYYRVRSYKSFLKIDLRRLTSVILCRKYINV